MAASRTRFPRRYAQPKLRFTLRGVSIVFRGRVIEQCPNMEAVEAYLRGWRLGRAEIEAEKALSAIT